MRLLVLLGFFCACLFTATNAMLRQPLELLVNCSSTSGLTTLRAARDKVRGLPRPLSQPVVVHVVGDCVALSAVDDNVLSLQGPSDSGDITWVAHRGAALHGGVSLPATGWTVVTEKEWYAVSSAAPLPSAPNATLLRINISALDLGPEGYGHFSNGGFSYCGQTRTELFVGERPMTIARFPNAPLEQGLPWMDWLNVGYTTGHFDDGVWCADSAEEKSPESPLTGTRRPCRSLSHREPHPNRDLGLPANSFTQQTALDPQRARRWSMTPVDRWRDAWLHGFWSYDWADNYIRVANVSVESETATFTYNASTQPAYGVSGGARFYVVNLAVELDAVGEYFIDDREGMLYFLVDPTVDPRVEPAFLSAMAAPLMVLHNVQNVSLVGWNVGYTRGSTAISVSGDETRNVRILNATGSNVGIAALSVDVGVGHPEGTVLIDGFTSVNAGCRAVALNGGDQTTLSESGVHFTRGQLSRYARWMRTYNPGVAFSGVGVSITLTDIGYAPHNGLLGSGNNHKFYNNTLHDLCYEVRDSGAFYIGRSWVNRGMVLRYNKFTRIQTLEPTALGANSVQAMYFDDQQSGVTADSNECLDSNACFLVGGGRDNIVTRNRCTNVSSSCILFDNRGMNWQLALCTNSTPPGMLVAQLEAVHYQSPPYSVEYPGLNTTMQDQPCVPVGNQFVNNTCCGCGAGVIDHGDATIASWGSVAAGNGHFCW